jgi:glycosyltransferase involved in cell wall biosynthesis
MKFSVIIATRNRPALFRRALDSVLAQTGAEFEIIVVDDGSEEIHGEAYAELEAKTHGIAKFVHLRRTRRGHGPAYALNCGAEESDGHYLCFLDDDDEWIDPNYLARAARVLSENGGSVDVHYSDQQAVREGVVLPGPIWIEDLAQRLRGAAPSDASGVYTVTVSDLLRSGGFCHLNTSIMRRAFFFELEGLDENLRYDPDRDFYLRAIDRARSMRYSPFVIARHHVPVASQKSNASTAFSALEKNVFDIRVLDHAILFAQSPEIQQYGKLHKNYVLKRMAEELARVGRYRAASYYASEALLVGFNFKWLAYAVLLWARGLSRNSSGAA